MLSFKDTLNYEAAQELIKKIPRAFLLPLSLAVSSEPLETEDHHTLKATFSALP